jgi:hypothetical protein
MRGRVSAQVRFDFAARVILTPSQGAPLARGHEYPRGFWVVLPRYRWIDEVLA